MTKRSGVWHAGQRIAGRQERGCLGQTYYFCSAGCMQQFDQYPEHYTGQGMTMRQITLRTRYVWPFPFRL